MKQKEVISTIDGCRLGYICDIEIDLIEGRIKKIIVPGHGKLLILEKRWNIKYLGVK